jgi:hypothetical protein
LGDFINLLAFSNYKIRDKDIIKPLIREKMARQVLWIKKAKD